MASVWQRLTELSGRPSERTGVVGSLLNLLDPDNWLPGGKDAAFTLALIALSAKMAVSDGVVTASELRAFQRTVDDPARKRRAGRSRLQARPAGCRRLRRLRPQGPPLLFDQDPDTLEHVLDGLFYIASADGFIHEAELDYLKHVSDIFGFDDARFEQIAAQHVVLDTGADPYLVLGLMPGADPAEVRRVYRSAGRRAPPRPADRQGGAGGADRHRHGAHAGHQPGLQPDHQAAAAAQRGLTTPAIARTYARRQLTGWPHPKKGEESPGSIEIR